MNKISIYEHSIKDIKAAFYDIIAYEETLSNNENKIYKLKEEMKNIIKLLDNELEEKTVVTNNTNKEETPSENIIPIDFSVKEEPTTEEEIELNQINEEEIDLNQINEEEIKIDLNPNKDIKEEVVEEKVRQLTKVDNKKARAILVLNKQITKLRESRDTKKSEIKNVLKEKEQFIKSVLVQPNNDDKETRVKELEEQIKKHYAENNFEMAEKLLNEIKELSN